MGRLFRFVFGLFSALFAIVFLIAFISALRGPTIPDPTVLHVRLDGPLHEAPRLELDALLGEPPELSLRGVTDSVRRAADDPRVVGLVLELVNPELGLAQIQEIEEAMASFRASGKWNVAFFETAGEGAKGDGAYALAASADRIVLSPPGDLNVVGLRAETLFFAGLFEKLDIGVHFEKRGAFKTAANQFTEAKFTPEHLASLKAVIDDLQLDLVRHVAARREVEEQRVWQWMKDGPQTAQRALELGMVDELAYWDAVYDVAKEKTGSYEPLTDVTTYWLANQGEREGHDLALIYAEGMIVRGPTPDAPFGDGGSIGSDELADAFRTARDDGVAGILFRVDSPGGSYIASDLIRREIELTRAAGIPIVVSMGNLAASGGYFVAIEGDRIVAQPGTLTGSIGVYAGAFSTGRFLSRWLGITYDAYQTAPDADAFSSLTPITDESRQRALEQGADRVYGDFVGKVAKRRGKEVPEIDVVAQGRVWTGRAALERGLVDELGGMQKATERLKELAQIPAEAPVRFRVLPAPRSPLEMLKDLLNGNAGSRALARQLPAEAREALGALQRTSLRPNDLFISLPLRARIR